MTRWHKIVPVKIFVIISLSFIIFVGWLFFRASTLGINNVLSREHMVTDYRPLTEEVAVDISRKVLEAEGYDTSLMAPFDDIYGTERLINRSTVNPDSLTISWGAAPKGTVKQDVSNKYCVHIDKNGSEIRCRVYISK